MPTITIASLLQVLVGLGLLNVWLVRADSPTSYRGGSAESLKAEFDAYGLPDAAFYIVGALKIGSGIALLAGLWLPWLVRPSAALVTVLMAGALIMHAKVRDPLLRSLPALLMMLLSGTLFYLRT